MISLPIIFRFFPKEYYILHISIFESIKKQGRCPKCSFLVRNNGSDSSNKDYLIGVAAKSVQGILLNIRTLRYTGCLATVVVLADSSAKTIFTSIRDLLNDCGIVVESIDSRSLGLIPTSNSCQYYWSLVRWWALYFYLKPRLSEINRILFVDLFDLAYQGDPFTTEIKSNSLLFSCEYRTLVDDYSASWVREAHRNEDSSLEEILAHPGINGGLVLGGAKPIYAFCHHLAIRTINEKNEIICRNFPDQGIINNMIYSQFCEKMHFDCSIEHHDSTQYGHVWTFIWGDIPNTNPNRTIGGLSNPSGLFYLSIHLYDRSAEFVRSLELSCPPIVNHSAEFIRVHDYQR